MMSAVSLLAYTLTHPPVPAGTIAALPTTCPCSAFSVAATGTGWPVGYIVRYPSGPGGTTVTFSEYAWATDGTGHGLDCKANGREPPPVRFGGPKPAGKAALRVSTARQGVIATNTRAAAPKGRLV